VEQYAVSPEKIDVIFNGVNEAYGPLSEPEVQVIRNRFSKGAPYFVFVGALHPRKNIASLFRAFDAFKHAIVSDMQLLIVGQKKWWTKEINDAYENMHYKNEVIFTGRLSPVDLKDVIGAAFALTYISYFEGFGIPIIEAMSCNVPVITSDRTSMPEISGGAALLVNPFSIEQITGAMVALFKDPGLRNALILKGGKVCTAYSWQKTADALWQCIERCFLQKKS
jgi:glycosyltransferase involved in cell wall biosynthesis